MENYYYNQLCPACKENTLIINNSPYHHIEFCEKHECDYKYEEYKEGYEEYLYEKFK